MAKKIVLVGAGHASIQLLKSLGTIKNRDFNLTLISDVELSPYSGMIPSFMAGVYEFKDLHFDLQKICNKYQFNFIHNAVSKIDSDKKVIETENGQIFSYDIAVINIGIKPAKIETLENTQHDDNIIYLKPISRLLSHWQKVQTLSVNSAVPNLTIIGGGAAAFEIAVACRRHFKDFKIPIKIITGKHRLLNNQNKSTQLLAMQCLQQLKIELIENRRVLKINSKSILLDDSSELARQICLIATSADAPKLFRDSNLPVDKDGFILVDRNLNVVGYKNLFAAGDCCDFIPRSLPKAGVFAVREGPAIFKNILNLLAGNNKLTVFKPQRNFLTIMVSGKNEAIASYRNFSFRGNLSWKLKDYIDRRFMTRFQ